MVPRKKPATIIKVALVGHGTGGHFYPLIAVSEALRLLELKKQELQITYYGPSAFDQSSLDRVQAKYRWVPAGKKRNYFSIKNYFDYGKVITGCVVAFFKLLLDFPDVIFSKGGFAAFPILIAAKVLRIPIIIHDSDTVPGRVSLISDTWADRVALSWPQAADYFKNPNVAVVGNPIRNDLKAASLTGGRQFLRLPPEAVVVLVLGGSSGAEIINDAILAALPKLLSHFHVIHQVGDNNLGKMQIATQQLLSNELLENYHLFGSLDVIGMARSLGAADLVITRAGASGLFETALIGQVPAFVIPITNSVGDHQRKNAYAFQRAGAGIVIEEANLKPDILVQDIQSLITDINKYQAMIESAKGFSTLDAADTIAKEIIQVATNHQ